MIESLKLALSIFDNKDEVYYPAAELAVYGWLLIPVFIAVVTAVCLEPFFALKSKRCYVALPFNTESCFIDSKTS